MELWLDTIDFDLIAKTNTQLSITGVTTNPSILAKNVLSARKTIDKLLTIQNGLVAVQLTMSNNIEMITQAKMLSAIDSRIIVKIPVTNDGLQAINTLYKTGIQTMATAIFEPRQVLLSAMAGATYTAPYFGRISGDNFAVLYDMLSIIKSNNYAAKLIVAAIRNKEQIINIAKLGVHAITIPDKVFYEFISNSHETTNSILQFEKDWIDSEKSLNI